MTGSDGSTTASSRNYAPTNSGKSSTYDRSMSSYLKNRLPYNYDLLDSEERLNTKYKYFQKVGMRRPEAVAKNSVALNTDYNNSAYSAIDQDKTFGALMYASASEDKPGRLRDYRTMAAFSEVADALDEICDECLNPDEQDNFVTLKFRNSDIGSSKQEEVQKQFDKYVEMLNLQDNGWGYFRQFLTEGELFFEQIIHEDYVREGVVAIENLPADMIDPIYGNIQNMLVKGFLYKKPIFDPNDPKKVERFEFIPFEENQIIYINNGQYNETKDFIVPFIENCRRAYRQLSMIEDSIVIHRMVHAPLRFVFNVDTGRLPVPQAESYLRKLQAQYWSTKTFDVDQNDVVKKYSPQSTLDSYWFAKRQGQEATTVQEIGGNTNLGAMEDLHFFIKKLYRSLKTPSTRLDPDTSFQDGTEILREELKFARMIIRQQQKFAAGIKRGFITHLKFRGMFDSDGFELEEQNLKVEFNVPTNFYDLRENQKLEIKVNMYSSMVASGKISDTLAKKNYLGWTDREILADREFRRKDAELEWEMQQIMTYGPGWKETLLAQAAAGAPPEGGDPSMGGGAPGGGGGLPDVPPDFGGGPAAIGGDQAEAFGGEANTTPPVGEGQPPA